MSQTASPDIAIAIGFDTSAALSGREQFLAYAEDVVAAYERIFKAQSNGAGTQTAGSGIASIYSDIPKVTNTFGVMQQSIQDVIRGINGIGQGWKSASDSADVFSQKLGRIKETSAEAEARIRAMVRASLADNGQNIAPASVAQASPDAHLFTGSQVASQQAHKSPQAQIAKDEAEENSRLIISRARLQEQLGLLTSAERQHIETLEKIKALRKAGSLADDDYKELLSANDNRLSASLQSISAKAGVVREGMVLVREVSRGDITRLMGSLSLMAQYLGVLTPGFIAAAGAATLFGAAAAAPILHLAEMEQQARSLDVALRAVGNTSGLSGRQLQSLAERTAHAGMAGEGEVLPVFRQITTNTATRSISADDIHKLTLASEGFATVTGKELPQATDALLQSLSGGYAGMVKFAQSYPTKESGDFIRALRDVHSQSEFMTLAISYMYGRLGTAATDSATDTDKAFKKIGDSWDFLSKKISHSDIVEGAYRGIGSAMSGLAANLGDASSQRAINAALLKRGISPEAGGGYVNAGVDLGVDFGPGMSDRPSGTKGAKSPAQSSTDSAASLYKAQADLIIEAARKQAAAYDLVGTARERALVNAQYEQKIAEARGDDGKVMELQAQRTAELMQINAKASAQAELRISEIQDQTIAQERLTKAAGDYSATIKAQIDNQIDQINRQNPGLFGSQQEAKIRADLQSQADSKRKQTSEAFFADLDAKVRDKRAQIDDALNRGAGIGSGYLNENTMIRQGQKSGALLSSEEITRAKQQIEDYNESVKGLNRANLASKFLPDAEYNRTISQIEDLRAHIGSLGLTEEQQKGVEEALTQAVVDANIKRLQSSQNWADGARGALMSYQQAASNYGAMAGNVVGNGMRSAENALVSFTMHTASALQATRTLFLSIIQDIARMQIQANITGPFSKALSNSMGGWFSSSPSTDYGSYNQPGYNQVSQSQINAGALPHFATGTDNAPGGLSLVGENGPELMQLPGGARIYPAGQTQAILSPEATGSQGQAGQPVTITTYVEAGANMSDVEAAVSRGISAAAPHLITAAVQQSVPASLGAVQAAANRGGSFAQSVGRRG